MQYKVGDKVRVNPKLRTLNDCESGLTMEMRDLSGNVVTIAEVCTPRRYLIEEDNHCCYWSPDCFVSELGMECLSLL